MSSGLQISPEAYEDLVERVEDLEDHLSNEVARLSKDLAQLRGRIHRIEEGDGADIDRSAPSETIQELQEDIEELRHVVNVDLDGKSYQQMAPDDKVREIQGTLLEEAVGRQTGKAAMDYTDVKWLFNGKASTGHVYDLMQTAGQETGFEYQERDENNRVVVDSGDVPDGVKKSLQVSRSE